MVYIIILVYNNWQDTIECLESVLKLKNINYKIIVVDNNSPDNSLEYIKKWAEGEIKVSCNSKDIKLKNLVYPLEKKPIKYRVFSKEKIVTDIKEKLIFIQSNENRGYAAGNNIGIRCALQDNNCEFIWILNNDVIVEPDSLENMIITMRKDKSLGMCGSKTYYYYFTNKIQCKGGFDYNKWLGCQVKIKEPFNIKNLKYINGASILVHRNFIERIGLLSEEYFLYYEEIDWAIRGGFLYKLGYSENSIIYHKEGGTINKGYKKEKSLLSDFYSIRNRILITKKFYKYCLPTVYLGIIIAIINRIKRKQYKRIYIFIKLMITFGNYKYKF